MVCDTSDLPKPDRWQTAIIRLRSFFVREVQDFYKRVNESLRGRG